MTTYYLFESAAGFALFQTEAVDETNIKLKQLQQRIHDFDAFQQMCRLKAFLPFQSADVALNNTLTVLTGQVTQELVDFLQQNLPQQTKKSSFFLALQDNKLAQSVQESLGVKCKANETTEQIFRGIREHLVSLLRNASFGEKDLAQAQLGLAHSVSRNKVALDINREDKHITQAICIVEQMDKDLNQLSMRIKEWYSWHFPELARLVTDNEIYVKLVDLIGSKTTVNEDLLPQIEEITQDGDLARQILEAAKVSMGQDISELDLQTLRDLCAKVRGQFEFRTSIQDYLKQKMLAVAPNLTTLIGENVGAKLISHAGSLVNLSKYPASTIQILGAEKALFRALKTKGNTPKYGLLYHSTFIGRANGKDKGKVSRNLANKCAIAARLDQFLINPTDKFGERMREQVEQRLKYLTAGGPMDKNDNAMDEVLNELKAEGLYIENTKPQKKKKSKKAKKQVQIEEEEDQTVQEVVEAPKKKKKTKQQV